MPDIRHIRIAPNTTVDIKDDTKIPNTSIGAAGGVAQLDATGKVPSSQLPSYVDDVLEYADAESFPLTGETGKIYVALNNNRTYRWSGTTYVEISESLALGETSGTAYRGDRGKTAYDHASAKGSAFSSGMYKITTNSEGHVTAATAVAKSDITGLGIPGSDTNTHRPIQVNGTQILGDNTTALNLKAGSNVSVTNSSGTVTIAATDTKYSDATTSASGLMSASDKTKLNGIATGAEVNQNAFSNVAVGSTTISADGKTDTLTLVAGSNITLTPDATNDKITIAATDTTYSDMTGATSSAAGAHGLVPAPTSADRLKYLRGDGTWAEGSTVDISGKADKVSSATAGDVATLDVNGNLVDSGKTLGKSVPSDAKFTDTTYSAATQSAAGLMSAADKTKLDGVATGATANVGTITGIKMNGASKGTSGVVDLGTVITSHQDISGKVTGPSSATNNAVAIFDGTGGKTIKNSGYTIGKSVPSDAKFTDTTYSQISRGSSAGLAPGLPSGSGTTKYLREDGSWQVPPDTNTWRPVQDNLTSTSTTDCLSANQGKVLNNNKMTGAIAIPSNDITALESGFYYGDIAGYPSGMPSTGYVLVLKQNNSYRKVYYMPYSSSRVFCKNCVLGTWSDWDELVLNSKIGTLKFMTHDDLGSLDAIKTNILAVASEMESEEVRPYGFYVNGSASPFQTGKNYYGSLCVQYKSSPALHITVNLTSNNGDLVVIGYNSGTWTINSLNDKIAPDYYINLGNITAPSNVSTLTDIVYDVIGRITTNGKHTQFECSYFKSSQHYVQGLLYPNKDYAFGTIQTFGYVYEFEKINNDITIDSLALNSNIANKLNGSNTNDNTSVEFRNSSKTGTMIIKSVNPSESSPSVWLDIDTANKYLRIYKDEGNGFVSVGNIQIG